MYYNTNLITIHKIQNQKLNYHAEISTLTFNRTSYEMMEKAKENLNLIGDVYKNNLSFVDFLIKFTAYGIDFKETNMIKSMVKVRTFPHKKKLKTLILIFSRTLIKTKY